MAHDQRRALERLRNGIKREISEALIAEVPASVVADELHDLAHQLTTD